MKTINKEKTKFVSGGCSCYRGYTEVTWTDFQSWGPDAHRQNVAKCRKFCCVDNKALGVDRFRSGETYMC